MAAMTEGGMDGGARRRPRWGAGSYRAWGGASCSSGLTVAAVGSSKRQGRYLSARRGAAERGSMQESA